MKYVLLATAALLFATPASADTIQQNGTGNVVENNSHNTTINGGNTYDHSGNVTANGGNSKANAEAVSISQGGKGGDAKATGGASQATTGPVSQDIQIGGTKVPRQAPAPASTFLTGGNSVISCLGSAGGSLTTPVGGVAFGGTEPDRNCQRILLSREIRAHGKQYEAASVGLLCRDKELREEMAKNGTPCPGLSDLAPSAGAVAESTRSDEEFPTKRKW